MESVGSISYVEKMINARKDGIYTQHTIDNQIILILIDLHKDIHTAYYCLVIANTQEQAYEYMYRLVVDLENFEETYTGRIGVTGLIFALNYLLSLESILKSMNIECIKIEPTDSKRYRAYRKRLSTHGYEFDGKYFFKRI